MYDSGPNWTRLIRTIGIVLVLIVLPIIVMSTSCTRIDAGHVGIRVKMTGSNRGVQRSPVTTGWVFVNPITEKIVEFPTKVLNIVWTRDVNEGSPTDESLTFASEEGVSINADVGLAFHIQPSKAPRLYERFREDDVLTLAHGYVRSAVREALNEDASQMAVQQIYGPGKTELLNDALARLNKKLAPDGFIIDQLTFSSALRLPENVVGAINRAMEATQNAIQAENRVRQIRAEAEQAVAAARGRAEAARQQAAGDADALLIRARAEAQANETIRLSTSPAVIAFRTIQKWDGQLPVVTSGDRVPMITMDVAAITSMPEAERRARLQELLGAPGPGGQHEQAPAPESAPAAPAAP